MQSVVTGQAPITLEENQMKTEDNTHNNWNKSYVMMYDAMDFPIETTSLQGLSTADRC